ISARQATLSGIAGDAAQDKGPARGAQSQARADAARTASYFAQGKARSSGGRGGGFTSASGQQVEELLLQSRRMPIGAGGDADHAPGERQRHRQRGQQAFLLLKEDAAAGQ